MPPGLAQTALAEAWWWGRVFFMDAAGAPRNFLQVGFTSSQHIGPGIEAGAGEDLRFNAMPPLATASLQYQVPRAGATRRSPRD